MSGRDSRGLPVLPAVTTAGQDATALAERGARALDLHAAAAGAVETLGANAAGAVTARAGAVHEHARDQAEQAGFSAQETGRRLHDAGGCGGAAAGAQLEQAVRVVDDAGSASALTSRITDLVRHAADVSAAAERELLDTASLARQLLDDDAAAAPA